MTEKSLEKVLVDQSVSDEKFFKILLRYLRNKEIKYRKSKRIAFSIHSAKFKKDEAETNRLRMQIEKLRPDVMEMLQQYVLKQHEHCCGPKSKK